jgi:hypothetical protein
MTRLAHVGRVWLTPFVMAESGFELLPPLVRRALRARRPFPSKRVLARRGAGGGGGGRALMGRGASRCGRAEGKG